MESYGEKIRKLREQFGLSQSELAKKLGVHKQMISDVERGKQKRFNPEIEKKLLELFHLPKGWLEEHEQECATFLENSEEEVFEPTLSAEEKVLLKYFRKIPQSKQLHVLACLMQCFSQNSNT